MVAVAESITESVAENTDDRETSRRSRYLKVYDIGVLLAALIVFIVFLTLLIRIVFPEGTRLGDLVTPDASTVMDADEVGRVDVDNGSGISLGNFIARLGVVRREVKIRSADSIVWADANEGASVRNRDAVQTFRDSRARVDFETDNELRIGQNSLVIFRSGAADPFLERRDAAVVIMDGELNGTINADYGAFALQFPAGLVELTPENGSGEGVDFRVGVNPDRSSTISVFSGQADINIAGEHFLISADQGLTITEDGRATGVRALPSMPTKLSPANNAIARYLSTPPRVTFKWAGVKGAQNYRLEMATDENFEEILVDEYLDAATFTHGNLASGDYFWRVSAREGWMQGPLSNPRRLSVVRDAVPPRLELRPIQSISDGRYVVRGQTDPQSTVFVLGAPVVTSDSGEFEHYFNPEPGTQSVVVESIDAVGNVAYTSQILHVPGSAGRSE